MGLASAKQPGQRLSRFVLLLWALGACAMPEEADEPPTRTQGSAMPGAQDATSGNGSEDAGRADDAGPGDAASVVRMDASSDTDAGGRGSTPDAGVRNPGDAGARPTPDGGQDSGAAGANTCGEAARNLTPFGCRFAWGTNEPEMPLANSERLGFMTKWVGYETDKQGMLARCDGCSFVMQRARPPTIPVYYAYFIGFLGSANGFADQNVNPNGPNLATDGAALIRMRRSEIVAMYAWYARETARAIPDKPLVWLLEGDFVQYTYKEQKSALSMVELAQLARDITCAIKSNMPKAVVALNHTTWLSDEQTDAYWDEMERQGVAYDLVWTTGVANNMGFLERGAKPGVYNQATATYAYVARKTGRRILVDTSFGLSGMGDTWANADADTLNARIADGVIAANVTTPAANYVMGVEALTSRLNMVCR